MQRMDLDGPDEASGRRQHNEKLKMFYGLQEEQDADSLVIDPLDINCTHFKADVYLTKLLRERSLPELLDKETEMVRNIRSLDSDMQTLVYENYNKFISATDTIRKMKTNFKKMEDEMDHLANKMSVIVDSSSAISATLQDRREELHKLNDVHTLLKKLQFLFELPARLHKCIEMEAYSQAVRYYTKARQVLDQYQHIPSFVGIHKECLEIVKQLRLILLQQFREKESSPNQLAECVDLLLQLNEPAEDLCDEFLAHAKSKIDEDLGELDVQLTLLSVEKSNRGEEDIGSCIKNTPMDILEFVDQGCNTFLCNMCLVIASYNDMFINRSQDDDQLDAIALKKLVLFVNELMEQYFVAVQQRVRLEKETGDNTILVRALDRFHRRLQAMNKLMPDTDFSRAGTEIVSRAARDRVIHYLTSLKQHFADCLTDIRQSLASPRLLGPKSDGGQANLNELLQSVHTAMVDQVKAVLSNLQAFIATDITFAMKSYFRVQFCRQDVREGLVIEYLKHVFTVCNEFCDGSGEKGSAPPALLLILSRLCLDLEQSTISYLVSLSDEQFLVDDTGHVTGVEELNIEAKDTAQKSLNNFVRLQGLAMSQMLRKSVETRDWLNTIEPRNVRAVMKRVVEDITFIDNLVGQLYKEGTRKDRSSDSTKHSAGYSTSRTQPRSAVSYIASTIDNSLLSNIQKLFSERIEIFSTVQFSKVSVLTGIIKISLKTFLECVRLRTFGRYGLQQIQVDAHYLQLYLWRFVQDENLVHVLLDEIVGSTIHRCLEPVTMEPSVVELICERG